MHETGYNVITPENVRITYDTAGIGARFVALIIDSLIQTAVMIICIIALFSVDADWLNGEMAGVVMIALYAFLYLGYFFIFEIATKGRTPGKMAAKLRVIRENGEPAGVTSVLLRNVLRVVDALPAFYAIGVVTMFLTPQARRLGDLVGGTIVVYDQVRRLPKTAEELLMREADANEAAHGDLSFQLTSREMSLLSDFLQRSEKLNKKVRQSLERTLCERFCGKFGVDIRNVAQPDLFLQMIYSKNSR